MDDEGDDSQNVPSDIDSQVSFYQEVTVVIKINANFSSFFALDVFATIIHASP